MTANKMTLIALVAITYFNQRCSSNLLPEKIMQIHYESTPLKPWSDINTLSINKRHIFREASSGLSSHGAISRMRRAPSTQPHDVIFVVEQRNMEELTRILHNVSDPKSSNYGKHMTSMEVHDLTANIDSHDKIVTYLNDIGARITHDEHKGEVVTARAPIEVWEKMFDTEFYEYSCEDNRIDGFRTGSASQTMFIRAEKYSVPVALHEHIASVLNTIDVPIVKNLRSQSSRIPLPKSSAKSSKLMATSLLFDGYMTPQLVNNAYNIDSNVGHPRATQAVYEGFYQYFSPEDVYAFQNEFNLPRQAVNRSIGNFSTSQAWCANNLGSCVEGNLDLQYIIAISNSPTTYYYTSLDSMAMWLQSFVNSINPPLIVSMSYTRDENYISKGEFNLFQVNAIKLGALGLTLLVAAGDDGVSSPQARGNPRRCGYMPTFPGSCPYVTAVGSTQVRKF
jgi:tripeptidyl-peptidase I